VTPAALATNNEYRSQFPAFAITKSSLPERTAVRKYATSDVATPENRYGGTNKGGYSNPEYDRLSDGFNNALERSERTNFVIGMMKFASDELPSFPLYYDLTVTAHVASLAGPMKSAPDGLNYWNIHEWEWR
jgi:ABC-type transport system substrate-binding protein